MIVRSAGVVAIALISFGCAKPNTAVWDRKVSPDGALDAVEGWEEDMAGATGGSGTVKVFVVPHGTPVDVRESAVARFYTNDTETVGFRIQWADARRLNIITTDYELSDAAPEAAIGDQLVQVAVIQHWKAEAAYHR